MVEHLPLALKCIALINDTYLTDVYSILGIFYDFIFSPALVDDFDSDDRFVKGYNTPVFFLIFVRF